MNRTPPQLVEPNYFRIYKEQLASEEAMTPKGKVAIFMSGLIMPENFRMADFYNIALKSNTQIMNHDSVSTINQVIITMIRDGSAVLQYVYSFIFCLDKNIQNTHEGS